MRKRNAKDVLGCDEQPLWRKVLITICIWLYKLIQVFFILFLLFVCMFIIDFAFRKASSWYDIILIMTSTIYLGHIFFLAKYNHVKIRGRLGNDRIINKILYWWEEMPNYIYYFIYSLLISCVILLLIYEIIFSHNKVVGILWSIIPAFYVILTCKILINKSWPDIMLIIFLIIYWYFNQEDILEYFSLHPVHRYK